MNTAATAEAKFGGSPNSDDLEKAARCFEDLHNIGANPKSDFGDGTKSEDEFGGDTKSDEEFKAIDLSIAVQRADKDLERIGLEFGHALIALRDKMKPEKNWMVYLEWLGIKYDLANKWINRVEGNETRHGKKKPKAEPSSEGPSSAEASEEDTDLEQATSWNRLANELKVLSDHACLLKRDRGSVGEAFMAQLKTLVEEMGVKIEPREEKNA